MKEPPSHFHGKDPMGHVAEVQARGMLENQELHGTEAPGHLHSGADSLRETGILLLALWILLTHLGYPNGQISWVLLLFSFGWLLWKGGRGAWLGWSRLERMHRIVDQERWEIEHHRTQEREELKEIYRAKGFEGKLLEEVMDVLMADEERLLQVMVSEELGLSLETQTHPLKQGIGSAIGVLAAASLALSLLFLLPSSGMWLAGALSLSTGAALSAYYTQNEAVPAVVWNLGLGTLFAGSLYFLLAYL